MPFPSIWSTYNILTFKNSRGNLVPTYEFPKNLLTMFPSVIPVPWVDFRFSPFCLSDYLRPGFAAYPSRHITLKQGWSKCVLCRMLRDLQEPGLKEVIWPNFVSASQFVCLSVCPLSFPRSMLTYSLYHIFICYKTNQAWMIVLRK